MNYPSGINRAFKGQTKYSNRGMSLEDDINYTNEYYLQNDIAVIYKKPTPITIVNVDYHSRKDAVITKAYFKTPSTTDYNGIYKSRYIDFEAKETKSLTSFPIANIHRHQIKHLNKVYNHGGIAFLIIRFSKLEETFLITYDTLQKYLDSYNKKSISLAYIKENGYPLSTKYNPRLDYLSIIDKIYF
ncbi:MAG: Holliday junction resolvase RecU [Firmicutes bacterium]|nr:Holliday junction resolvase RecU [Bacillota bacterium]